MDMLSVAAAFQLLPAHCVWKLANGQEGTREKKRCPKAGVEPTALPIMWSMLTTTPLGIKLAMENTIHPGLCSHVFWHHF